MGFKKGHKDYIPVTSRKKQAKKVSGENHYWYRNNKKEDLKYAAIHKWIVRNYGLPTTCEHCQRKNLKGCSIHWANKDHNYKFDRTNWLRLCARCHKLFDLSKKNNGNI